MNTQKDNNSIKNNLRIFQDMSLEEQDDFWKDIVDQVKNET